MTPTNNTPPEQPDAQQPSGKGLDDAICSAYLEDPAVCDGMGEVKGQCYHCGYKWYQHALDALPEYERASAYKIRQERCLPNGEHVHHYQRGRASLTGLRVELGENIETRRLVVVVTMRIVLLPFVVYSIPFCFLTYSIKASYG